MKLNKILITFFILTFNFFILASILGINASSHLLNRTSSSYQELTTNVNYQKNEIVEAIVVLEGDALIDQYNEQKYDDVNDYISSSSGQKEIKRIEQKQNQLIEEIKNLNIDADFSKSYQYKVIASAISLKVQSKYLVDIYRLQGVKDVFVSNYYKPFEYSVSPFNYFTEDEPYRTDSFMDTTIVNDAGYTGKGTSVAVIDSGMDVTHIGFSGDVLNPKYTKESIDEIIKNTTLNAKGAINASSVYYNSKIPYAYDYADSDNNVYNEENPHGSHVAGIVGANASVTRGVAVDTQIFAMKVFPDVGEAFETYILAALEDCVLLDVDVINMSLGSACGSSYVTGEVAKIYGKIKEKGINVITASGNDRAVGTQNMHKNNLPLASSPDYGLVAEPAVYHESLAVSCVENKKQFGDYLEINGDIIVYNDSSLYNDMKINNVFDGKTISLVEVPGYGRKEDYTEIDVKDKIALVARGEVSFTEKHDNAFEKGAIGLIVYNPIDDKMITMEIEEIKIPSVFIQKSSYQKIKAISPLELSFSKDNYGLIENIYAGQISVFSDFGTTPNLEIKPEISAPGGYIYSTVNKDNYEEMSGTSMAAPNLAGGFAVLIEYLNEKYPNISRVDRTRLANCLVLETADPIVVDGIYTSVRSQGAGIANINDAILANAIIEVENQERPKAELGSSEYGVFEYTFKIKNTGTSPITYTLDTIVMTDDYVLENDIYFSSMTTRILESNECVVTYSNSEITVDPNSEETITVKIEVTSEFKEKQNAIFVNGSYVEGYTMLKTPTDEDLVIPFLGFYGDFDQLPILEGVTYDNDESSYNMVGCFAAVFDANTMGSELGYDPVEDKFYKDKIYYSCNSLKQNQLTTINGLFRNIDYLKTKIYQINSDGTLGDVIYEYTEGGFNKSFYYNATGSTLYALDTNAWNGTKPDGTKVLDGEKYHYVTTVGIYKYGTTDILKEESWSFDFTVDSLSPTLNSYRFVEEDGKYYLELTVEDNYEPGIIAIYDYDINEVIAKEKCHVTGEKVTTVRFSLDEINQNIKDNNYKTSQVKVFVEDFARNFIYETITIGPNSIKAEKSQKVAVGGVKNLNITIVPTTINMNELMFKSSDDRIATVDQNGKVTGVSSGVATITISCYNGYKLEIEVEVGGSVDQKIEINRDNFEIEQGKTTSLKASFTPLDTVDTTVTWTSSNPTVATISSFGFVEALKVGKTTITAKSATGNIDKIEITVTPPIVEYIYVFTTQTTFSVGYKGKIGDISITPETSDYSNITFTSSDESIMKVFNDGTMEAVGVGTVYITLSSLDGLIQRTVKFLVASVKPTQIDIEKTYNIPVLSTLELKPNIFPQNTTDKTTIYEALNEDVLTVDEFGVVNAKKVGISEIKISCQDVTTSVFVNVLPIEIESISSNNQLNELRVGEVLTLSLDIYPDNATYKDIIWTSQNKDVATVIDGIVYAKKEGVATINAKTLNNKEFNFFVVVNKKQEINKDIDFLDITLKKGKTADLIIDEKHEDVIFKTSSDASAVIANNRIYAIASGKTLVEVVFENEVIDTFTITVEDAKNCSANTNMIFSFIFLSSLIYFVIRKK